MQIREVWMSMREQCVTMPVCMWFISGVAWGVLVLVMIVVHVRVFVLEGLMRVQMLVLFGKMKIDAKTHKTSSESQLARHRLTK